MTDALCAPCGKPPSSSRWNRGDSWCHGCKNFICFDCHIQGPGVIPSGPHDLDLHRQPPKQQDLQAIQTRKEETPMPIVATAGSNKQFIQAPAGVHNAVCVDVADLGLEPNKFDATKPDVYKVRIIWELEEKNPDTGNPFTVASKFTLSINKKSSLRKFLIPWRGRDFTEEEEKGFDVEKLIGVPCLLQVLHNAGEDGQVWANVASVMPHQKGQPKLKPSPTYVRVKDRPKDGVVPSGKAAVSDDDGPDVPF
jgi:hypothetical protein